MDEQERFDLGMQHALEQSKAATANFRLLLLQSIGPLVADYYLDLIARGVKPRDAGTIAAAMQTAMLTGGKPGEK